MIRETFFEWLDACPSANWEIVEDGYGNTVVSFMYEERLEEPEDIERGVTVTFEPQATIHDRIVDVDPQGDTTFTVDEAEALKLTGCERLEEIESRTYSSDGLKDASTAPLWIRQWTGPFDFDVSLVKENRS